MRASNLLWILVPIVLASLLACEREAKRDKPSFANDGPHVVVVHSYDPDKQIQAIQAIREAKGVGLAEAKEMLDDLPESKLLVKIGLTLEDADALQARLVDAGMEAEVLTVDEGAPRQDGEPVRSDG